MKPEIVCPGPLFLTITKNRWWKEKAQLVLCGLRKPIRMESAQQRAQGAGEPAEKMVTTRFEVSSQASMKETERESWMD